MASKSQLQNMNQKCQLWELADLQMEATFDKCLAFCQALVSSNQKLTFTSLHWEGDLQGRQQGTGTQLLHSEQEKNIFKPDPERKQKGESKETEIAEKPKRLL